MESCTEVDKKPDQPFKSTFNVRISPELHRKAVLASNNSLNAFVSDAIQEKLVRLGALSYKSKSTRRFRLQACKEIDDFELD